MLSIGKLGTKQERYYLDKVAEGAEDYYSGKGEAEGYWLGDAALDLGLEGAVEPDQLVAMLTGSNPATGAPLGLRAVHGRGPVPGFDLTFSSPKSVSLLWALGGAEVGEEIAAAHRASVDAALDYLQREACLTRRGAGGANFLRGNGFIAAAYVHRSSRAGDPQLHTHVLIANATKAEGRWTRLYHPAIYHHAKTAGYLFEAQLREELTQRLGVRWQEVRNGIAEIDGFADEHLREFSTRRKKILEAVGEDASARARQVATLTTRKAKAPELTTETLRERWEEKAEEIGLSARVLEKARDREPILRRRPSIERIEATVTAHVSHFDRRAAIQAVAELCWQGAPAAEVERIADVFLASESVLSLGETPKGERFTTVRIWEIERHALDQAEELVAEVDRAVAGDLAVARVTSRRPGLKPDQRRMVERLLCGGDGLVIVVGEAGTGKTYATLAAAEGWAEAGIAMQAAAPTWRATNVLRAEGLEATSIARLLAQVEDAARRKEFGLPFRSVLLIDEAGMVDSRTLARLIEHAQRSKAKLVLVGDPEQLGEIEAGGLFGSLLGRTEPVVLDEVIRHNHDLDREAAKLIREGRGAEGLSLYRSEERVVVAPNAEERREAMVADWWQSFGRGEDSLMVARRNVEVGKLNELARQVMREEGRLGETEIEVGGAHFAVGDQVITRINDHRAQIYNRERWRVASVDAEAQAVVLDGIDTPRRVCVDAVYLERVTRDGAPAIQHAYAATVYQAQGSTVDRAYVAADPSMTKQDLYVATSRSREETWIYATPEIQVAREEIAPRSPHVREGLDHIAEASERDGAQVAAHDLAAEQLRLRVAAARVSPPRYIVAELGERPTDPAKRRTWDRTVAGIESFRQEHRIEDRDTALGRDSGDRLARRRVEREIERSQRQLGLEQMRSRDVGVER
jgi:conjugative relaxase-like TrwC/TraI family protein